MIKRAQWEEHRQICMMDSKTWLEQKKDREYRETLPALAEGDEIAKNLKRFAS